MSNPPKGLADRGQGSAPAPQTLLICKEPGCPRPLRTKNVSGYCQRHMPVETRRSRALSTRRCKEPGCPNKLGHRNTSGYCIQHHFIQNRPSIAPSKLCKHCGKRLRAHNKSGFCRLHRYAKDWASAKPKSCGKCGAPLSFSNESGYCSKHWHFSQSGTQNREVMNAKRRSVALQAKVLKAKSILSELGVKLIDQRHPAAPARRGRKVDPKKAKLYEEAAHLKAGASKLSWGQIARKLVPDQYAKDPNGAASRLRLGAEYHQHVQCQSR